MKNYFVLNIKQLKYSRLEKQVRWGSHYNRNSFLIQFVCPGGRNQPSTFLPGPTPGVVAQHPAASAEQVWQDPQEAGGGRAGETWGGGGGPAVCEVRPVCPPGMSPSCSSSSHWRDTDLPLSSLVLTSKIRLYWQPNWWNENINIFFKNCIYLFIH